MAQRSSLIHEAISQIEGGTSSPSAGGIKGVQEVCLSVAPVSRRAPLANMGPLSCHSLVPLEEMAVQQSLCHVVIILGSLFESNLLNTPPDEISGIKKTTQLIWPKRQSKAPS